MANSKKVSLFLLLVLFGVCAFQHFGADAYRLSRNTDENGPKPIASPFGATGQLSKFASSRYQAAEPSQPPPAQCPESMFTCKSSTTLKKNNDLFQQRKSSQFFCIDQSRLCDGQADCPLADDESELYCPTVLEEAVSTEAAFTTASPETAVAEGKPLTLKTLNFLTPIPLAGCYLCKSANSGHSNCISMSLLCNGQADCPLADDEHVGMCSNHPNSPNKAHPQSIASGTSSFSTNQFSPTNITIVNSVPKDEPYFGDHGHQQQQQQSASEVPATTKDLSTTADLGSSKAGVHNGVGFMFRVDNLVIYNSQVKMFNQNSENISPVDEEARQNATGAGRYQQQQQQPNLNGIN